MEDCLQDLPWVMWVDGNSFSISNAPRTFMMSHRSWNHFSRICIEVYFDDVFIYSPNRQTRLQHSPQVLTMLQSQQLRMNVSKCVFMIDPLLFLRFLVGNDGIWMDPKRMKALDDGCEEFYGSCFVLLEVHQEFWHNYCNHHRMLEKRKNMWNSMANKCFKQIKNRSLSKGSKCP